MSNELKLGQALAYLHTEMASEEVHDKPLFFHHEAYVRNLYQNLTSLKKHDNISGIFESIPRSCCSPSKPFLSNNEDFFLAYTFLMSRPENMKKYSSNIMRHLNSCIWCFDIFCQVMQDYYHTTQLVMSLAEREDYAPTAATLSMAY